MTKILIINGYTWYNKGDSAIIIGMIESIRTYIHDAEITFLSESPDIDTKKFKKYNINVLGNLLFGINKFNISKLISIPKQICNHLINLKFNSHSSYDNEALKAYRDTDIIFSCGGGYLGNYYYSIIQLYRIYFGKMLGKKVIIYAQSIEPCKNIIILTVLKFVLSKVDLITIREEMSYKYIKSLNINKNIFLTADCAFLVNNISSGQATKILKNENIPINDKLLVGMTVKKWRFPDNSNPIEEALKYEKTISEVINFLILNMNAHIILFPQVIAPNDDDRIISNLIKNKLNSDIKLNITILNKDYSIEELKGMMGMMDIFVGTRMHSNIFSTSMCVPTVAIAYENKTHGIMKMLNMSEYVLNIDNLNSDELILKIKNSIKNKEKIKLNLSIEIPKIKKLSLLNIELSKKFINN